jgi:asparagine synthase (glutamine-hydrolysing)
MCGLNGIFAFHSAANPPSRDELIATREHMAARGPDGVGEWWSEDRRFALGFRRLAIQDLAESAGQPMVSEDGSLVIVFNGEIYNAPELRAELQREGRRFRTSSDTEVILQLYAAEGGALVHRLRGMYAFAIWDNVHRRLFLARDPYGIKPLYTANDGWTFRFASQVKALLAGGRVSRDPEPAGVVGFHLFGSVPEPFTLYREIRALPAGYTQLIDEGGPREPRPFANLAATLGEGSRNPLNKHEIADSVKADVQDSVRAHLIADVEVGHFLSAGVDSGALLGLMRNAGAQKIRAITLGFDEFRGTAEDEAPLAAQVAGQYGAEHIVRRVNRREFDQDLPAILEAMDQPSIDGVNTWFVAKAAKEAGLKVALSGLGGDELLAGYPSFVDLPRWRRRYGLLAAIPGMGALSRQLISTFAPGVARRQPKALGMLQYARDWPGLYLLRRGLYLPQELRQFLDPDLVSEGLWRLKPLQRLAAALRPDPRSDVGRVCALESTQYMRNQLLRDADWAGMAHSVEIRVPLVDYTLLRALSPALPGLSPGFGKAALAAAPVQPLAHEITTRAKTGFGVPIGAWMDRAAAQAPDAAAPPKGMVSRKWSQTVLEACAA